VKAYGERDLAEFAERLAALRLALSPPSAPGDFVAYTDGACFGNPQGNGGWAAAVFQGTEAWQLFGHLSSTSNNRAEALGVLGALEWVPAGSSLRLHSDSELTVRQLQGRYKVKANSDIWAMLNETRSSKQILLAAEWVRGHAGDPLNELADRLSKAGALNREIGDVDEVEVAIPEEPRELVGVAPRTDWERDFVASIRDQLRKGRGLSEKQLAVLERIRAKPNKA
jgi:ribonuclease HI